MLQTTSCMATSIAVGMLLYATTLSRDMSVITHVHARCSNIRRAQYSASAAHDASGQHLNSAQHVWLKLLLVGVCVVYERAVVHDGVHLGRQARIHFRLQAQAGLVQVTCLQQAQGRSCTSTRTALHLLHCPALPQPLAQKT